MTQVFGVDSTGAINITYKNANNANIGAGVASGNFVLSFGETEANEAGYTEGVLNITQRDEDAAMSFYGGAVGANISASGTNMTFNMNAGSATINMSMDTTNSYYNRQLTQGTDVIEMSKNSKNNRVDVGMGSDYYIDNGTSNFATGSDGPKYWETTESSSNALILGSLAGTNSFYINGTNNTAIGRSTSSINNFYVDPNAVRTLLIGGGGVNNVVDNAGNGDGYGSNTFYIAGSGETNLTANGAYGIYDLRNASNVTGDMRIYGGYRSYIFKGSEQTLDGKSYNIYDTVANQNYNWTWDSYMSNFEKGSTTYNAAQTYVKETFLNATVKPQD